MDNKFLKDLNDSQFQAVKYINGPSLVVAGAGSGKTRVLTYKIAYLLTMGLKPWNILALTFTNKAAREMKERIGVLVGQESANRLNMGTFHSIFARILRVEADKIGFTSNFTIYDETDSRSLLKNIVKEMKLDDKIYKPASIHAVISQAKNELITDNGYAQNRSYIERDERRRMPALHLIYTSYASRCRQANAMDFDDLLLFTFQLFEKDKEVCSKYEQRYKFILVDEYQDTNYAQQRILEQLTQHHHFICAVGDDAQSIYGFRGANIDNILGFQHTYKDAILFKLEQNYRSTQSIVEAANSLIKHNEKQIPKETYSKNAKGDLVEYIPTYSDKEEVAVVCKRIDTMHKKNHQPFSDFAILYRTNSQSRAFEEQLLKMNIPYRIYGGLSFYQRKEIKDVIAYFRLVTNPDDEEAFRRIINYPARGIGNTTMTKIIASAQNNKVSLWEAISHPNKYNIGINKGTMNKLSAFTSLIQSFISRVNTEDAFTLGCDIIKQSGIHKDLFEDTSTEGISRQENLEELIGSIQRDFVEIRKEEGRANETTLFDYLQDVSLMTDVDSDDMNGEDRVSLMTIHNAKGLEFNTVFVVGLEENIFPNMMSLGNQREIEEERRLLYVAITRAEKHCILTSAENRYRYGQVECNAPSRFIKDISPKWLKTIERNGYDKMETPMPWDKPWYKEGKSSKGYQNNNPVAFQFKADKKRRIIPEIEKERPSNPFGEKFIETFKASNKKVQRIENIIEKRDCNNYSTTTNLSKQNGHYLKEGCTIEHQRFGKGKVIKIEGEGENLKATVEFQHSGTKALLVKFAKFTIIG